MTPPTARVAYTDGPRDRQVGHVPMVRDDEGDDPTYRWAPPVDIVVRTLYPDAGTTVTHGHYRHFATTQTAGRVETYHYRWIPVTPPE